MFKRGLFWLHYGEVCYYFRILDHFYFVRVKRNIRQSWKHTFVVINVFQISVYRPDEKQVYIVNTCNRSRTFYVNNKSVLKFNTRSWYIWTWLQEMEIWSSNFQFWPVKLILDKFDIWYCKMSSLSMFWYKNVFD